MVLKPLLMTVVVTFSFDKKYWKGKDTTASDSSKAYSVGAKLSYDGGREEMK
jgi:hypothetical protein